MKERGFSLLEIMVAVSVMAILAIMIIPSISAHSQEAKKARAEQDLHNIALDIQQYVTKTGGLVPELVDLGKHFGKEYPNDPFTKGEYIIEPFVDESGEEITRLRSTFGTEDISDDICVMVRHKCGKTGGSGKDVVDENTMVVKGKFVADYSKNPLPGIIVRLFDKSLLDGGHTLVI